jgi:hypothetical protein
MREVNGNKSRAAQQLGISRTQLYLTTPEARTRTHHGICQQQSCLQIRRSRRASQHINLVTERQNLQLDRRAGSLD